MLDLNVTLVAFSFKQGGAAIAAERFAKALTGNAAVVQRLDSDISNTKFFFIKRVISYLFNYLQFDGNKIKHSLNIFSDGRILSELHSQKNQVFNFHWINNDVLSVFDFDLIPSGSVITLHDEWLYCGSEHYYNVFDNRDLFAHGYRFFDKKVFGLNWNFIIWKVKLAKLAKRNDIIFTVPSNWMLSRAKSSMILKDCNVKLLANPIDTSLFSPCSLNDKSEKRSKFSISSSKLVVTFGAIGGKSPFIKGAKLLDSALEILAKRLDPRVISRITIVTFGGEAVGSSSIHGFSSIALGHIKDQLTVRDIYCVSDFVVVPSLVESFGQVAAEAASCAIPVVCFDTSGLRDIVVNETTGLVAEAYNVLSLANAMQKMIDLDEGDRQLLGKNAREHIETHFSVELFTAKYLEILREGFDAKTST